MKHEACERWTDLADREAEGESLGASERAFLTAHVLDCAFCAKEARFYELLAEGAGHEPGRERVVDAVLRHAADGNVVPIGVAHRTPSGSTVIEPDAPAAPRVTRTWRSIATAAIVLLGVGVGVWAFRPSGPEPTRSVALDVGCSDGPESARLCLEPGSVASSFEGDTTIGVVIERGAVSVDLPSVRRDRVFVVRVGDVEVRAIGTAFTVDADAGVVRLHEGRVTVGRDPARATTLDAGFATPLREGRSWRMTDAERNGDLARFDGQGAHALGPIEPTTELANDESEIAARSDEPEVTPSRERPTTHRAARRVAPEPTRPPTAADALREARGLLASGRTAEAQAAYEALVRDYSGSAPAWAARVALGRIELDRGRASEALAHFDAYLRAEGGPLRSEASYGRVVALRRLGRSGAERAAIETLLREQPGHVRSAELHTRLEELVAP